MKINKQNIMFETGITLEQRLKEISNNYPDIQNHKIHSVLSITFIIPTFNSANTILFVLDSISNQTRLDLIQEVIIIDDCSSDETSNLLSENVQKYPFTIKVIRNKKRLYSAASRNLGIKKTVSDLICFIDSDIILSPDYVELHSSIHTVLPNSITISLREDISITEIANIHNSFPAIKYSGDFRFSRSIVDKTRNSTVRVINLIKETNSLRDLGFGYKYHWTLPELCLTCAITYKTADLKLTKGAPENFIGWGFNDVSMAAKVISLDRFVIPLLDAGVLHIKHPPRSGKQKYVEFSRNKKLYRRMLSLPIKKTFRYYIECLDKI